MTITTENLSKRFNREWIFRDFSFTFKPGTYALTGPNGSGKSTLLQVLWGQVPATAGSISYVNETSKIAVEDIYEQLSLAAPYVDLVEELTLNEILHFHFSFKKIRAGKTPDELVELLELSHARNKEVRHFSSGMKQRLKLGLAFFSDVSLLFLDEPTTNLDKQSVAWYWRHFNEISAETVVLIASNNDGEYPPSAIKVHLPDYKRGYK